MGAGNGWAPPTRSPGQPPWCGPDLTLPADMCITPRIESLGNEEEGIFRTSSTAPGRSRPGDPKTSMSLGLGLERPHAQAQAKTLDKKRLSFVVLAVGFPVLLARVE